MIPARLSRPLGQIGQLAGALSGARGTNPFAADLGWLDNAVSELEDTGWAAEIYDADWRLRWVSSELRIFLGRGEDRDLGIGAQILDVYRLPAWEEQLTPESRRRSLEQILPFVLADSSDPNAVSEHLGVEEIEVEPSPSPASTLSTIALDFCHETLPPVRVQRLGVRLYDANGSFAGTALIYGPGMRASILSLVARGDEQMFERMSRLIAPGRQRVAILFADLERSSALSRRLPSAVYFQLISSFSKAIDDIVISHDGVVGKHVGDGVSAFFIIDDHGSASATSRAALAAALDIRRRTSEVAAKVAAEAGLTELECRVNIGLHFGATVYMGQIVTGGRLEVTALGDEVNECARIEQSANGGAILASKPLLERLDDADATALGLDLGASVYTPLAEIASVSRKAARDAGQIPVLEL